MSSIEALTSESWEGSFASRESTLHQLSPYIGKLKSAVPAEIIRHLSKPNDTIFDPFAGSGTVGLESWIAGRNTIVNDLNPYCQLLLKAKLQTTPLEQDLLARIERYEQKVAKLLAQEPVADHPQFVSQFFHPDTLRETVAWARTLRDRKEWFLLACLMGILHHQRPGFLSFPSSHAVPYLRSIKFPQHEFPKLYEYRSVPDRLTRKVHRALSRVPNLDDSKLRTIHRRDAAFFQPSNVNMIITSPPYMRRLSYGRDNRLRLWFLGAASTDEIDRRVSPNLDAFLLLMKRCIRCWGESLVPGGHCVVILGDEPVNRFGSTLPQLLTTLFEQDKTKFVLDICLSDEIPSDRRVRRGAEGSKSESILVMRKVS